MRTLCPTRFFRLLLALPLLWAAPSQAITLAPSAIEVRYDYSVRFRSLLRKKLQPRPSAKSLREAADFHASHLDGVFHAPDGAERGGYPAELVEGFAGTKSPEVSEISIDATASGAPGEEYYWIRYHGAGTALLLRPIAESLTSGTGELELPLLADLPAIYSDDAQAFRSTRWLGCTDSHYNTADDFGYFYNPYRCPELGSSPTGQLVRVKFSPTIPTTDRAASEGSAAFPSEALISDNGNGKLTTLYFLFGFDSVPAAGSSRSKIRRDDGWKSLVDLAKTLENQHGFSELRGIADFRRELGSSASLLDLQLPVSLQHDANRTYVKTFLRHESDGRITVVRGALFNTENETGSSALRSFPKFWKEAWENGDFVYYGGHSGDGQSMDLDRLHKTLSDAELSRIRFKRSKVQLAFFDSCSSYAHFQSMYLKKKPEGLHLVSYGVVSLFHLAPQTVYTVLDQLVGKRTRAARTWVAFLKQIELDHLAPHMNFFYSPAEAKNRIDAYSRAGLHPTHLLNVWIPE